MKPHPSLLLDHEATLRRDSGHFVEYHLLPLLAAFVLGWLITDWRAEAVQAERVGVLLMQVHSARAELATSQRHLALYDAVCAPLLSLPIESTPELIPDPAPKPAPPLRTRLGGAQ